MSKIIHNDKNVHSGEYLVCQTSSHHWLECQTAAPSVRHQLKFNKTPLLSRQCKHAVEANEVSITQGNQSDVYMDDCKITQEVMNRMPMKVFWEVQTLENHINPDYGEWSVTIQYV